MRGLVRRLDDAKLFGAGEENLRATVNGKDFAAYFHFFADKLPQAADGGAVAVEVDQGEAAVGGRGSGRADVKDAGAIVEFDQAVYAGLDAELSVQAAGGRGRGVAAPLGAGGQGERECETRESQQKQGSPRANP